MRKSTSESGRVDDVEVMIEPWWERVATLGLADRMQQRVRREAVAPLRAFAEVAVRTGTLVGGLVQMTWRSPREIYAARLVAPFFCTGRVARLQGWRSVALVPGGASDKGEI